MPIIGYYRPSTIVGDRVAAEKILKLENVNEQADYDANEQGCEKKPENEIWFGSAFYQQWQKSGRKHRYNDDRPYTFRKKNRADTQRGDNPNDQE